jgi:hypothetical protein
VLLNLAVNARDAMPKGGRLTIATANVQLDDTFVRRHSGAVAGPHVCLTVQDAGCGMTADVLAHVFEPFFTTKPQGQGTGLGLSTVYGIVKQNGGYITIDSRPNAGTAVKIFWPRRDDDRDAPGSPATSLSRPLGGTETILLVEDEPGIRGLMRKTLAVKILYVSGFPSSLLSEHDRKRHRVGFLPKPFTPQALAMKVRECLDS